MQQLLQALLALAAAAQSGLSQEHLSVQQLGVQLAATSHGFSTTCEL